MITNREARLDVFAYSDYRLFLNAYIKSRKALNGGYSIRAWCRRLGFKSPATLNMILRGHRDPGDEVLGKFNAYFRFSQDERDYFECLVKLSKHQHNEARKFDVLEKIKHFNPNIHKFGEIDLVLFSAISNWYYAAILSMVSLRDFKESGQWISKKLRSKITAKVAAVTLQSLIDLGFLTRSKDGRIIKSEDFRVTPTDIPSEAIKRFHEQILDLARGAIREISVNEREYSGLSFTGLSSDLPAMKKEFRKLVDNFSNKFRKKTGDASFQFNCQLFPLTAISALEI